MDKKWDNLAEYFSGSNASSADNVELVEPVIIEELERMKGIRLIDFGCGAGRFCRRISGMCEKILGIDSSKEMIRIAENRNPAANIHYSSLPIYDIDISGYNVLNAEFVLQFLPDRELEKLLAYLSESMIGDIIISNHRLEFIDECIRQGKGNYSYEKDRYSITISGNTLRFYPRSLDSLKKVFKNSGFGIEKVQDIIFPESFLKRFPEWKEKPVNMAVHAVLFFKRKDIVTENND